MAEILAMEMKSAGMYVSRGLSYKQAEVRLLTLSISRQLRRLTCLLIFKLSLLLTGKYCTLFNQHVSAFYSRFLASFKIECKGCLFVPDFSKKMRGYIIFGFLWCVIRGTWCMVHNL